MCGFEYNASFHFAAQKELFIGRCEIGAYVHMCRDPDQQTSVRGGVSDPHSNYRQQAQACTVLGTRHDLQVRVVLCASSGRRINVAD